MNHNRNTNMNPQMPFVSAVLSLLLAAVLAGAGEKPKEPEKAQTRPADGETRKVLAEHQTVSRLKAVEFSECRGLTARCPDDCGHSGDFATFDVLAYVAYQKPGDYGDPKAAKFTFQVEDNRKNLKVSKELAENVRGLKPGDYVVLDWRHEYVTRTEGGGSSSFPERPVVRLIKLSKDDAEKMIEAAKEK